MADKKETKQQSIIGEKPQPIEDEIRRRAYEIIIAPVMAGPAARWTIG